MAMGLAQVSKMNYNGALCWDQINDSNPVYRDIILKLNYEVFLPSTCLS